MSVWAQIILAVLKLAGALADAARERRLLKAGEDRVIADNLKRQADDLLKADAARDQARSSARAVAGDRGLPDDGWRRD